MTIVEFFSTDAAENWIGTWVHSPDKVVLVGDDETALQTAKEHYTAVAESYGRKVKFFCELVPLDTPQRTAQALEKLLSDGACAFDLCGGKEPYLTAAGMLYDRYPDRVTLLPYDGDEPVKVSLQEWMSVYGGRILYPEDRGGATQRRNMTAEFIDDIYKMWEICRKNPPKWNFQVGMLHRAKIRKASADDPLQITVQRVISRANGSRQSLDLQWVSDLENNGVINRLQATDTTVTFSFKNADIKSAFHKEGQLLELLVAATALRCKDEKNHDVYTEAIVGAVLDWDGKVSRQDTDLYNEIDALLMHGTVPVFVSCKNGDLDVDELFKLHAVTRRFGGKRAKCVLVAPRLDELGDRGIKLAACAEDLRIRVIEDIETMPHDEREMLFASLWKDS